MVNASSCVCYKQGGNVDRSDHFLELFPHTHTQLCIQMESGSSRRRTAALIASARNVLLLTAGQLTWQALSQMRQLDKIEHFGDARLARRPPQILQTECDVFSTVICGKSA
ncbi:hypothetical protein [Bradyrhizobium sp. CW9]|uniref:hypothetical protein n=1 Tax=Bradyrhizobium sp. CW9 TaxID=2782689 RepID=UPI001FF8EA0C|nr:hypothetical protein [Bradyrhizobium sp. CW9]